MTAKKQTKNKIVEKIALIQSKWMQQSSTLQFVDLSDYLPGMEGADILYIENRPMSNFLIHDRGPRILDNRGFSVRISRQNAMFLFQNAIIDQGRILEPCHYVRHTRNNYGIYPVRTVF